MLKRFKVTGPATGPFPFDMLRYDECWPATERDAHLIEEISRSERRGRITIELNTDIKSHAPTPGRWASFMWKAGDE